MTSKIGLRMAWLFAGAVAVALAGRTLSAQQTADSPSAEAAEQRSAELRKFDDLERRYAADDIHDLNRLAAASLSQRECVHCHFKVPKSGEAASLEYWAAGPRPIAASAECAKCHDAGYKPEAAATKGECPGLNPHCRRNAEKKAMTTYLGVSTSPVPAVLRGHLKLPSEIGLLIEGVEADSPAAAAGVAQYDVLEKFDSQWLVNQEQFSILVRMHHSGDEVALEVVREGQPKTLAAKLGEREASAEADASDFVLAAEIAHAIYSRTVAADQLSAHQAEDGGKGQKEGQEAPMVAYLGVGVSAPPASVTAQLKLPAGLYLLVDTVDPESPAATAGIEPGDVLQKFDDQLLVNPEQFSVLVRNRQPGEEMQVTVIRAGKPLVLRAVLGRRADPLAEAADVLRLRAETVLLELDGLLQEQQTLLKLQNVLDLRATAPESADDEEFLRRAYLDTTGALPSPEATAEFHANSSPDKRAKLIDRLLSRPEAFAKFKDSAALQLSDAEHSLSLAAEPGGKRYLVAKDKSGGLVWAGPVDEAGQREKLPPVLAAKLTWMVKSLDESKGPAVPKATADALLARVVPKFTVKETTLETTLKALGERAGVNIVVNRKALERAGVDLSEPITLELEGVRLASLLKTIFALAGGDKARIGFSVEEEVIVVSATKADP